MPDVRGRPQVDLEALLVLAINQPARAQARALSLLTGRPTQAERVYALQALGIVLRDRGETVAATGHLRRALRAARALGEPERIADVLASLGITRADRGDLKGSIADLRQARSLVQGGAAGRVLTRLGWVLVLAARYQEARETLTEATTLLTAPEYALWLARARNNRGLAGLGSGDTATAHADFVAAEQAFRELGQLSEATFSRHNQGSAFAVSGNIPRALTLFADARRLAGELDLFVPEMPISECWLLLAAGLAADARQAADGGLRQALARRGYQARAADLSLWAARAALAVGDTAAGAEHARTARRLFLRQARPVGADRAVLLQLQSRLGRRRPGTGEVATVSAVADRFTALRTDDVDLTQLLAGRVALAAGQPFRACVHLRAAARSRHHGAALNRITGWVAQALLRRTEGSARGMLAACDRGLAVLEEYRYTLGATEARATATTHGRELVELGLRHAVARRDPRQAIAWNERLRGTPWLSAPAAIRADPALVAELAELRDLSRRLARQAGDSTALNRLRDRREELETSIRHRVLRREGNAGPPTRRPATGWRPPAGAALVELFELDGRLHAVTATCRRTRLHEVGPADPAVAAVQHSRILLRRAARGSARHLDQLLTAAGRQLQTQLLGPAAAELEQAAPDEVALVVSSRHYAAPWSLLPALAGRGVTLASSGAGWLRTRTAAPPVDGHVTLVCGPGLETGGGELGALVAAHRDPRVLTGPDATAERVLGALEHARLAHIAAHGSFRSDNPQFSSLRLADGPLTVFDLERLHRPPHRLVLASCDSGVMAPAGADELLGLVNALVSLGTAGVLAPISVVNDAATVSFMSTVHDRLANGAGLVEAARAARAELADDPLGRATGASFLVFGA